MDTAYIDEMMNHLTSKRKETSMLIPKKLTKVLAITVAALQIPLFMLWTITLDAFKVSSSEIQLIESGYDLVFQWDKLASTILSYLPIMLALITCLVLSVMGLIFVLRKKHMTILTVCFYAATVFACGFLRLTFAAPAIIMGEENAHYLMLSEYIFFRYFGGMELRIINIFPLLEAIKFIFLDLLMVGSGILCGLGIADLIHPKAEPVPEESEFYEIKEQTAE